MAPEQIGQDIVGAVVVGFAKDIAYRTQLITAGHDWRLGVAPFLQLTEADGGR